MSRQVHGLMQDPDHEYLFREHFVEHEVPARDQLARTPQEIGTVHTHLRIVYQPRHCAIDVVEIAVRLRLAPVSVRLDPDVDEIGSCRLGVMNVTHQERRSGSALRA